MEKLIEKIRRCFPAVEKPLPEFLTVHGDGCTQCSFLKEELALIAGPRIERDDVWLLFGELSLLSPQGFRWVLPYYMESILAVDADSMLVEFLAYHFSVSGSEEEQAQLKNRMDFLSCEQIACIQEVLRVGREELGRIWYNDFDSAIQYLQVIRTERAEQVVPPKSGRAGG